MLSMTTAVRGHLNARGTEEGWAGFAEDGMAEW